MKQLIHNSNNFLENHKEKLINISTYIWENPEIGYEEHKACKIISDELKANDFSVELSPAGLKTAFVATKTIGKSTNSQKPIVIGLLSEYDALPELGHACGHNLFSVAALGAAICLCEILKSSDIYATIKIIGTPAEEGTVPNAGGKIILLENGVFDDLDIAMMCHAEGRTIVRRRLAATASVEVVYHGKAAHIGCNPPEGISAMSALQMAMNNINTMRWSFPPRTVVGTKITQGGVTESTIPDLCAMEMSIRAPKKEQLYKIIECVKNCVKAGAIASGCEYEFNFPKKTYENIVINETLADVFAGVLDDFGVNYSADEEANYGWDVGNVSHVCPTIAPYIKIGSESLVGHSPGFREASCSKEGFEGMILGAKAMCATIIKYLFDKDLQEKIAKEFKNQKG